MASTGLAACTCAWALAGFVILTALTYGTNALGLHAFGLALPGLVGVPMAVPLLALAALRRGCRLTVLELFLPAPILWVSFFLFIAIGGAVKPHPAG